ncbi:MAG: FecR domain-containing protein [Bacteroidales bacterium]|jgi:transmembrane sensor|nr:FecR domain-containing protein [Bacteroidales bacterium]
MKEENENIDISVLLFRYINGEATENDIIIIRDWLQKDPSNITLLHKLRLEYEVTKSELQGADFNPDKAYSQFQQKITNNTRKTILKRIYYSAASVAALFILLWGIHFIINSHSTVPQKIQYRAQQDSISKILLPDSSSIFLNSGSTLVYDDAYNNDVRKIAITGEAFFSVQPDSIKPFIVNIDSVGIQVVGTSFSVFHDSVANEILVTVKTGKVKINYANTTVFLKKLDQAIVNIEHKTISKSSLGINNTDAWVTGVLKFENAPLIDVVKSINKHFNYNISIDSEELKQKKVFATFNKKDGVEIILRTLVIGLSVNYEKKNGEFVLYDKNYIKK